MPLNDSDEDAKQMDRRSILKAVGAGAVASLGFGTGIAAADGHCWYEYDCLEVICPYPDDSGGTEQRRECCEDPDTGEVTCGDWETSGCCTLG